MLPIGGFNLPDPEGFEEELTRIQQDPRARFDKLALWIDNLMIQLATITEDYHGKS